MTQTVFNLLKISQVPFMSMPQSQMKYHQSKMKDCLGCHAISV